MVFQTGEGKKYSKQSHPDIDLPLILILRSLLKGTLRIVTTAASSVRESAEKARDSEYFRYW